MFLAFALFLGGIAVMVMVRFIDPTPFLTVLSMSPRNWVEKENADPITRAINRRIFEQSISTIIVIIDLLITFRTTLIPRWAGLGLCFFFALWGFAMAMQVPRLARLRKQAREAAAGQAAAGQSKT